MLFLEQPIKETVFYNTFEFVSREDIIYYILFTVDQLNLNPEETPIVISGKISKEDEYYKIIYKYIRNVSIFNSKIENKSKFYDDLRSDLILTNSF